MSSRKVKHDEHEESRRPPAPTLQGRENQLVQLAIDEAERQMREGTASSQIISYYLKLGSSREQLEQERIQHENELTRVKIEAIHNEARKEEMFANAIKAMRGYQGVDEDAVYDD